MPPRPASLLVVLIVGLAAVACTRPRSWVLMQPPEVADESYPRGYRLVPTAPIAEWRSVAAFGTEAACDAARKKDVDDSIDHARVEHGKDAKYELGVRRAVNAVCVTRERK
ncbi:MAG TPA: hypothetical protein VEM57_07320 [Candidatus Binatus sp.]|nr:hypothetical protein [Candidatus Binatus sp.]